jgi:hypothetical protein
MKQDDKNEPKQDEQRKDVTRFDLHPVKPESLIPAPKQSPVPSPTPNVNTSHGSSLTPLEETLLFVVVLLAVALAGVSFIYAAKYVFKN